MKIYLDTCCLQRPLDDQSQQRIKSESEAILAIFDLCETGIIELVSSEILEIEISKNSRIEKQAYMEEILATATTSIQIDDRITNRAQELEHMGFKGMDAYHLAAAEAQRIDYFCSCDDRLVKRAKSTKNIMIQVVTPLELSEKIATR